MLNVHRDPKKQRQPLKPTDFLFESDLNKTKASSARSIYAALKAWAQSFKKHE